MNLQPGIQRQSAGDRSRDQAARAHVAPIQGYTAPQKHELTGKDGTPLTLCNYSRCQTNPEGPNR